MSVPVLLKKRASNDISQLLESSDKQGVAGKVGVKVELCLGSWDLSEGS